MATEGASGEPGSGGREDSAATVAVMGLAGEGGATQPRLRGSPLGLGRSGAWRPASAAPSLRPSSPPGRDGVRCGTRRHRAPSRPGQEQRGARGLPPCGSPSSLSRGGGFSLPLFLPVAPARGRRAAPVRSTEGAPLSVSPLPYPPPLFPPLRTREGAAPVLSGRAEVLTAAGAAGPVRPGRGEMLLFNPLPGPQGAWLSPAFGDAFSAQRHRPFSPPQVPVPSAGCVETSRLPGPAPQGQDLAPCLKYPQKPSRTSLPAGVSSLRVGEAARREAEGCGAVPADG